MYSCWDDTVLTMPGCPIQKSPDQRMFSSSPKLIAAFHVFHLHLTPRHPPFALSSLATIPQISLNTLMRTYLTSWDKSQFIKWSSFRSGSTTKLTALYFNQSLLLTTAQLIFTTTNCQRTLKDPATNFTVLISQNRSVKIKYLSDCTTLSFLWKEVIQPLIPQRLPCYDFTPIINHTLGACLPCGLAQRRRV